MKRFNNLKKITYLPVVAPTVVLIFYTFDFIYTYALQIILTKLIILEKQT